MAFFDASQHHEKLGASRVDWNNVDNINGSEKLGLLDRPDLFLGR